MCKQVITPTAVHETLADLIAAGFTIPPGLRAELRDNDLLSEPGTCCFCCFDPCEVLEASGIPYEVDEVWGDLTAAADP